MDLFKHQNIVSNNNSGTHADVSDGEVEAASKPLAEKLRPTSIEDMLLPSGSELEKIFDSWLGGHFGSFLLYGAAGSGKTSFLKILSKHYSGPMEEVNAVDVGVPRLRAVLKQARDHYALSCKPSLLFIDEAHRLKAPQQDFLLPDLENGTIVILAATTENPSYRFSKAFLSRLRVLKTEPLLDSELLGLVERGVERLGVKERPSKEFMDMLVGKSSGDARRLLGDLETTMSLFLKNGEFDEASAAQFLKLKTQTGGNDLRIDALSALIKSMRASDEKASVYYTGLLLAAGEDPEVILRRMIVFASEDIGVVQPQAVGVVNSLWESYLKVGMPESGYALYQGASYLATAKKSRRHVEQKKWAENILDSGLERVSIPENLKNHGGGAVKGALNLPDSLLNK